MHLISLLLEFLFWIFLALTILGLVRPWWVLWFLDFKNRLTVLRFYGYATLLLGIGMLLAKNLH